MLSHIVSDLYEAYVEEILTPQLGKKTEKPSDSPKASEGSDSSGASSEKRIRQAVYDIRYRARREEIELGQAFNQYMSHTSMNAVEKKAVKEKLGLISGSGSSPAVKEEYVDEAIQSKKFKVRVTDKNSGKSYVRMATREKINSLRSNPNISSVEMTSYGEPYEGERSKGEQTASATSGKDWDGDGKKESPAKEYRGVVHNAIQKKRGQTPDGKDTSSVKEEFLGELNDEKTIDVKGKKKPNKIIVHHKSDNDMTESSYSKFLGLLNEREMTTSEKTKEKKLKAKYDDSGMKVSMIKQYGPEKGLEVYFATIRKQSMKEENCDTDKKPVEDDPRSMPTKISNFKNKLRAMGLKMSYELEGEVLDERRREDKGKPRKKRDPAIEMIKKSPGGQHLMTRSGKTISQHEAERNVSERDRPKKKEETTADRLALKKQRQAAAIANREREDREEERRRRLA
jgi:hypothetical protein